MKTALATASLLAIAANAQAANYTLADVATHASATDCWMVLNSTEIYNLTAFIPLHPGGSSMVPYCGKDGTQAFNAVGHSANAINMEATYLIGTLTTAPLPVSVSLAPTAATVTVGGTAHFSPTVANSTAGVAWTIAPSSLGTISSAGLFTAVGVGGGTVTATSTQDPTKSATASITVVAQTPTPPPTAITVSVAPSALSLRAGAKHQFTANVANSNQGVTWKITGSIGTIDDNGLFKAGQTPGTGSITATSVADPTKSATVEVTVTAATCGPSTGPSSGSSDGRPRGDDDSSGARDH